MSSWRELMAASDLPPLEAQLLAMHVAGRPRSWIIAHDGDEAAPELARKVQALFARRRSGEPVAYILGEREFHGLMLEVTPDVLIPRPETELLVDLALERLPRNGRLLDLCTGSGAIAVAVAHQRPDAQVWASDVSPAALAVARRNAERHGAAIRFVESDVFNALDAGAFHVIASNPPYVAEGDTHLSKGDLPFEPRLALVAGAGGMDLIQRIAVQALDHLHPGGWLLMEHGHDQREACTRLLAALGYAELADVADLAGVDRVIMGRKPSVGSL